MRGKVAVARATKTIESKPVQVSAPDTEENKCVYEKKKVDEDQNMIVRYASKVSKNNLNFLSVMNHENGLWTVDGKSKGVGFDGKRAIGLCQFYPTYKSHIINDPRFGDYHFQVDECWKIFRDHPTQFNAWTNGMYRKHLDSFSLKCQ